MRLAAYAALLAVAHGTALAQGDRDQVRGPGWSGRATDASRSLDARAAEALAWSRTAEGQRRGCDCSPDRSGGHADAAGF
jgi:hypothetical protein